MEDYVCVFIICYIKNCLKYPQRVFCRNGRSVSVNMHPAVSLEAYWRRSRPVAGPWWYKVTVSDSWCSSCCGYCCHLQPNTT
jgi:hypothetical protein